MKIRKASYADLANIVQLEAQCFPKTEAANELSISKRLLTFPECFWLLEENGALVSLINGMVADIPMLQDRMYEDASMHNPKGEWQMIFGVATIPEQQHKGYAKMLMEEVIKETRALGRKGIVLTCKEDLLPFYEQFGFVYEGVSMSKHGGVEWNDMRLLFAAAI